jgi:flagellar hook-basal body complex protein FliE
MIPVSKITNPALEGMALQGGPSATTNASGGGDFAKQLMDVLKGVNETQTNATAVQTDMMTGRHNVDYHDLMIAMEKASVALDLTVAVRNKLLEAYQTVSQTQV